MKMSRRIIVGAMVSLCLGVSLFSLVSAYDGTIFNRTKWHGYFKNVEYGGHFGRDVISGGVPAWVADGTKNDFKDWLMALNSGGAGQNRTGSAFMLCTLLGKDASQCVSSGYIDSADPSNRNIQNAGLTELNARFVNSPNITMEKETITIAKNTTFINTLLQIDSDGNAKNDDMFFTDQNNGTNSRPGRSQSGLVFYYTDPATGSRSAKFQMFIDCANPIGTLPGLPQDTTPYIPPVIPPDIPPYIPPEEEIPPGLLLPDDWFVLPVTSVNKFTAKPGDTIIWKHMVTNINIFQKNTENVSYWSSENPGDIHTLGTGFLQWSSNFTENQEIHDEDVNRTFCRSTKLKPWSSNAIGRLTGSSLPVCVSVVASSVWDAAVDTTISKETAKPLDSVTWTHKAKNSGPDKNNLAIGYGHYITSNIPGVATGKTYKNLIPINTDGTGFYPAASTYTNTVTSIPYGAKDGDWICQSTYAVPRASSNGAEIISIPDCVTITNPPWQLAVTSTAQVDDHGPPLDSWRNDNLVDPVEPLDKVRWKHTVKNTSANPTNQTITYSYKNSPLSFDRSFGGSSLLGAIGPLKQVIYPAKINGSGSVEFNSYLVDSEEFDIGQDDVGKTFCRSTVASPKSHIDAGETAAENCFTVPYNYTLEPHVSVSDEISTPTGTKYTVTSSVKNDGPTKSRSTAWQLTKFVKTPSAVGFMNAFIAPTTSASPASFAGIPAGVTMNSGNNVFNVSPGIGLGSDDDATLYAPGTKICYVLSVQPYSSTSALWRNSTPFCVSIGKKPKVQVWGGDVWSKGKISMLTTLRSSQTYGSWAEYALFSSGFITNMASKSMFNGNLGLLEADQYSPLSFTNWDAPTNVGKYNFIRKAPDISANYPTTGITLGATEVVSTMAGGVYTATSGSTITLTGGQVAAGKTIIINAPKATVDITGDIKYDDSVINGIEDIPQLLIIAKNINISKDVTNVDAWLVAVKDITSPDTTGIIDTCSGVSVASIRITGDCENTLRINGPVIAKKILLKRTYGSDSALGPDGLGLPAETINFRADAYLWATAQSAKSNTIRTVYSVEQPPRF